MEINIEDIDIGDRRREDYGDIAALAQSIKRYGMMQPVVVDSQLRLIAGGRRLQACRFLGWTHIEAKAYGDLSYEELREMELEENLRRKDLTPYEASRDLARRAPAVAEAISSKLDQKAPQGRPREMAAPKEDIAEALGTSKSNLIRAEQHIATAEAYPFMQSPDWSQSAVLQAKKLLDAFPAEDRSVVAAMVGEPGVPPTLALSMMSKLAEAALDERREALHLYQSSDPRDRDRAMTWAADRATPPDPRLIVTKECLSNINRCIRQFPNDPEVPEYNRCVAILEGIISKLRSNRKGGLIGTATA